MQTEIKSINKKIREMRKELIKKYVVYEMLDKLLLISLLIINALVWYIILRL
jgi:hypothetical protein